MYSIFCLTRLRFCDLIAEEIIWLHHVFSTLNQSTVRIKMKFVVPILFRN